MLAIFRTNQQLANILLLFYLALMRASTFINPMSSIPKGQGVLSQWLYAELPPNSLEGQIAAFILVFVQAVFINILVAEYRIATDLSLLPGLFYCLITSMMPEFMGLSPILLANSFIILSVFFLLDCYKNNAASAGIFDAGFWLGLSCLFHFPFCLFIVWGIIGLAILRGVRLKEIIMFLVGILIPFFLFGVYLFWTDNFAQIFKHFTENFGVLNFVKQRDAYVYIKIGIILFFVVLTLFSSGQLFVRRNIATQKYISIIYWMMLMAGLTVLVQKGIDLNHLLIVAVPLSILLSMMIQKIGIATAEVLHVLLMVIAMIFQYQYLLG